MKFTGRMLSSKLVNSDIMHIYANFVYIASTKLIQNSYVAGTNLLKLHVCQIWDKNVHVWSL